MMQWMSGNAGGEWVKVLQFYRMYTPTANQVGDVAAFSKNSNPPVAKLSDAAINAIPSPADGYHYFKLVDANDVNEPWLLVRTQRPFADESPSFGWAGSYEVCNHGDVNSCVWKPRHSSGHFDTEEVWGNGCGRWFTDYGGAVTCYLVSTTQRCFNKGDSCNHAVRDNITVYKWSAVGEMTLERLWIQFAEFKTKMLNDLEGLKSDIDNTYTKTESNNRYLQQDSFSVWQSGYYKSAGLYNAWGSTTNSFCALSLNYNAGCQVYPGDDGYWYVTVYEQSETMDQECRVMCLTWL